MDQPSPIQQPSLPPLLARQQKSGKLMIIIGALILLTIGLLGGYFLSTNLSSSQLNLPSSISPTLAQINTANPSINPTADWQTYTNDIYSFQYPSHLNLSGPTSQDPTIYLKDTSSSSNEQPQYYFYLSSINNTNKLSIHDIATQGISEPLKSQIQLTQGVLGQYMTYTTDMLPSQSGSLCTYITQDETKYVLICMAPYNAQSPVASRVTEYNQMLSTFKFN